MAQLSEAQPTRGKIGELEIDVVMSEEHIGEVEVTQHPVEQGADPTDHARERPDTLRLECFVSNTPVYKKDRETLTVTTKGAGGRARGIYDQVRALKSARQLLEVTTSMRVYSNMMMTSLSAPRSIRTGDGVQFSVSFVQVRVVQNRTIEVPTLETRAKPKNKLGQKSAPTASEPLKSRAAAGFDGVSSWFTKRRAP